MVNGYRFLKFGAFKLLVCLGGVVVAGSVMAQDVGRYRLEATETGYVRLDTQTGTISVCNDKSGQLVCKMAADDRRAYEDDLDTLQNRVTKLEEKLNGLEKATSASASSLPSEEEFEKTMSYMERFMRRFMGIAKSFDSEPGGAEQSVPGRT